jgi:tRNA1Val (adenine37-N6)-methyltransferase
MSNNYFEFKQFTVTQNHSAMKVGTDGVLLGSWVAVENARTILDIGTGTGLLSLMLAQKSSAVIDAIEIDAEACIDAQFNFAQSPWNERLKLLEIDFLVFSKQATKQYDLIVSNPPFFKNSLHSPTNKKTVARHSNSLPHEKLVAEVTKLLTDDGRFYVVLPSDIAKEFIILSRLQGLHPKQIVKVFSKTTDTKSVRIMLCFSKTDCKATEILLSIYDQSSEYTIEYKTLTKDFYLANI